MEISVAVNYILSHLYTKLPRRRVDNFGEELERYLHLKFQHHWYPHDPVKDAPYRCLNVVGPHVDLLFPEAAAVSGLDWNEIQACLPEGLVLSIDPGHVACQFNQPTFGSSEISRFNSTPFWPNAPLSLSSSGCSSASSSISSSNVTPNANQVTHQVLYCVQDSWLSCSTNSFPEGKSVEDKLEKELTNDFDHNDHLATATALSVLAENDDLACGDTIDGRESIHAKTLWSAKNPPESIQHPCVISKTTSDSSRTELRNTVIDNKPICGFKEWNNPEYDIDSTLLAMLNAEGNTYSASWIQSLNPTDKAQLISLLTRANNRQNTSELPGSTILESPMYGGTNNCSSSMFQPIPTKYDQSRFNPLLPTHPTILNPANQFVQKSISTPSFTAATFAQTKFGSTKLKNHAKRTPNRIISPTNIAQGVTNPKLVTSTQKESLVVSGLVNNLRPHLGTTFDMNTVQGQARKSIVNGEACLSLDSTPTAEERFNRPYTANAILNNLSGATSFSGNPLEARVHVPAQGGLLDEFLNDSCTVPDIHLHGKYGLTDTFHGGIGQTQDSSILSWPNGFERSMTGTQGPLCENEWLQPPIAKPNEIKRPIGFRGSPEQLPSGQETDTQGDDFGTEDTLLSTQMVALLLEDNGTKDVLKQNGYATKNYGLPQSIGVANLQTESMSYPEQQMQKSLPEAKVDATQH